MKKLKFDSGIQEFQIGGAGVLRFNPADPNVYARFVESVDRIKAIEKELVARAEAEKQTDTGAAVISLMHQADQQMKAVLGWVFGGSNDFDQILDGVNLLAVGSNGERIVTNLFAALQPVLAEGARTFAREQAAKIRGAQ